MNYEFLNPTSEGEGEGNELDKEAQKYGIQPVQIQAMDNDKLEVKRAYLGLVFYMEESRKLYLSFRPLKILSMMLQVLSKK